MIALRSRSGLEWRVGYPILLSPPVRTGERGNRGLLFDDISCRLTSIGHVARNLECLCRCRKLALKRSPSAISTE